jgi:hypothetical protein
VSNLYVKQQCESEHFIIFDDNLKRLARDFHIKQKEEEREQDSRDRERACVRGSLLRGEKDSDSNKMDY